MANISEQRYLGLLDRSKQYLDEYRLLDRITRMDHRKHKKSYTERKLNQVTEWIRTGRGQGRGDAYCPWIRITRGFSSPVSHQMFSALTIHKRNHHFLSKLEHHTALQLAYLGAVELRECLPMWPTEHQHPLETDPRISATGLLEIARSAGIKHGNFVGSNVPYIASLDMMATVQWKGQLHHVGISCKPREILMASPRAQERAKLDEMYCHSIGTKHIREDGAHFNPEVLKNLQTYHPSRAEILQWAKTSRIQDFSEHLNHLSSSHPLHACITQSAKAVQVEKEHATALWRVGLWLHLIDIDVGQRISMCKPIKRGRDCRINLLASHFLGIEA